ncbi:MAG: hypothetical protein J6P99_03700 [Paludibacteraceae bacterium]|nr:hypothetical protein [Paludibacteraceae bacterium]
MAKQCGVFWSLGMSMQSGQSKQPQEDGQKKRNAFDKSASSAVDRFATLSRMPFICKTPVFQGIE